MITDALVQVTILLVGPSSTFGSCSGSASKSSCILSSILNHHDNNEIVTELNID